MIFAPIIMAFEAAFISFSGFFTKRVTEEGVKPKSFLFSLIVSMTLLSGLSFIFIPFEIEQIELWVLGLIILAAMLRALRLFAFTKSLKDVTPLELSSIISLSVVVTYALDLLIGSQSFSILAIISLIFAIVGSALVSKGSLGFSKAKWALLLQLAATVGGGYLGYIILQYTNSATYMFLMSVVTTVALLPLYKKFEPSKLSLKRGAQIQVLGFISFIMVALLIAESTTLYLLGRPFSMALTFLFTYTFKKGVGEKPTKIQIVGALSVLAGILVYSFTQF